MNKSDVDFRKLTDLEAEHSKEEVGALEDLRMKRISERIQGGKVLDVGCVTAMLYDYIKDNGVEYHGVDISEHRVKDALKRAPNVVRCDVMDGLPYKEGTFDYIVLGEIIEHVEDPVYLLRECRRVLKEKGKLLITTPNARSFINTMAALFNRPQYSLVLHLFTFSKYELWNILKVTGFKVNEMKTLYFRPIPKRKFHFEAMLKIFPQMGEVLFFVAEPEPLDMKEIANMVK